MNTIWARIKRWQEKNGYPDQFTWGKPASDDEIAVAEATLKIRFPTDVRETFLLFNGDEATGVLETDYLFSLDELVDTWKMLTGALESGTFSQDVASPGTGIKPVWWNPAWIPVSGSGGDLHCLDFDPGSGGKFGQIIDWDHETGPSHVVARSFREWISAYADELEAGKFEITEAGDLERLEP